MNTSTLWDFLKHVWKNEKVIISMVVLGILLILFIPFLKINFLVIPIAGDLSEFAENPYHLWEVTAAFWSMIYLIFFIAILINSFSNSSSDGSHISRISITILLLIIVEIGILLVFVRFNGRWIGIPPELTPIYRALAEMTIPLLFCICDILLYRTFRNELIILKKVKDPKLKKELKDKKRKSEDHKKKFFYYLRIIDGPAFLAFLIILIYLITTVGDGENDIDLKLSFLSGASAINLIVINTIFTSNELYRSYKWKDLTS